MDARPWSVRSAVAAMSALAVLMLSPSPVRALGRDQKRNTRFVGQQVANPVFEHLIGVGHPIAQMQNLKPRIDRERLDEASDIGYVLIKTPRVRAVAASGMSEFVDRPEELGPVLGVDAIFGHDEHWTPVVFDLP